MGIAIVGGGIAGLALALNLHARGIGCTIYEAAPEFREIGVGITILPHAMREIAALGLQAAVEAAGIENRESLFFNRFGQRVYGELRGRHAGYAMPECGIHRAALHAILFDAVKARLGEVVKFDRTLSGIAQDDDSVTMRFHNQAGIAHTEMARIVIACDGVNSAVRRHFYPNEELAFAGINTWRGVTRMPAILDGRTYLRIGTLRTGKLVIYPIADQADGSGDQLVNWVAEIQSPAAGRNDWNRPGRLEDLLPIYGDWRFDWLDVPQMLAQADLILEYPMVDRDPVGRWTFGRVTLVGDAAHPMYPRGSNGSAQALIDARVLATFLAESGIDLAPAALERYAANRIEPTAAIVRANRSTPPDSILMHVESLTGDRPFSNLDAIVSQHELQAISQSYSRIAGFALDDVRSTAR